MDFYTVEPCTTSDAFELKFKEKIKIDMERAADILKEVGEILAKTAVVLVLKTNSYNASIYATGRILMKNVNKEEAEKLGKDLASALESGGAFV